MPCKRNERTIRATVESLLGQDYDNLEELILVGDLGDSTWTALDGIDDPRLITMEEASPPGRDPNVKRHAGIGKSRGELIALSDSDIVMPPDWLSRSIRLMAEHRVECVTGGMKSIHSSFWGRYVDNNRLGAKTPRNNESYLVIADDFGLRRKKPPVTSNVVCTRQLYEACPLDVNWLFGYEDYEWFWRVASSGHPILVSSELNGLHHHRRGLIPLAREYLRASHGCSMLIKAHPDCPLSRKRRVQAVTLSMTGASLPPLAALLTADSEGPLVIALAAVALILSGGWEYARSRSLESLAYPLVTVILGSLFVVGLVRGLISGQKPAPLGGRAQEAWTRR
ncbi:MAG TPA: glycosyltransferase family 2 protein [Streptosporangiaceae bacterium]|nr:glycosyltransferase family 2 protein [Streptosporangiaceae bacterium]